MWFDLAVSQGNEMWIKNRDLVAESMTREQIVEAQNWRRNGSRTNNYT